MKKNLLDKTTVEEIITRAISLQVTDKAKWGSMEVTEMLHHCNLANKQILEGELEFKNPSLKQRVIGFFCLYILLKFPKNIKRTPAIDTKGRIAPDQFEEKKGNSLKLLTGFLTVKILSN